MFLTEHTLDIKNSIIEDDLAGIRHWITYS